MVAELICRSNYSFLRGASHPEELIRAAAQQGYEALAITDLDGVYGLPKAFEALRDLRREQPQKEWPRLICGAELRFHRHPPLVFLVRSKAGWSLLCRLITRLHAGAPKGEGRLGWEAFLEELGRGTARRAPTGEYGLYVLSRGEEGARLEALKGLFGTRLKLTVSKWLDGRDDFRVARVRSLARRHGLEVVAVNESCMHQAERKPLQDAVTAIREGVTLEQAGYLLQSNSERWLKPPARLRKLFSRWKQPVENARAVARDCAFELSELKYRYPVEWIPQGMDADGYLRQLVEQGAVRRYPQGLPEKVRGLIEKELALIAELAYADYFLTIHELVDFARSRGILCQGRGSAANSAVCYCLGLTAIDPARMDLLFERFLSAERDEPPDIDVDFEHERREEVIQHLYERYGRHRAAMVSAVITYRGRLAVREASKVLGRDENISRTHRDGGLDEVHPQTAELARQISGFPRHLSIHSGGFVLSGEPLIDLVPVEPARMPGRTIIQWDKYDLDYLGLLKIDVLALGMLTAIRKCLLYIWEGAGDFDPLEALAAIPAEDKATYDMLCLGDSVGVFQVESRAQINMLGRLKPRHFYDLVIEVAIVRPGPIVGKMVHPYLRRRKGEEPVDFPDPRLEQILGKTLGVPLFQEQIMRLAIELAGFSGGEADQLRRAIGAWRSLGSIQHIGKKLIEGLTANGLSRAFAEQVFAEIQGFAEYGFPESHSASFALLVYASAWLKRHHPAAFLCALINSQPLGFYSNHSLMSDARNHGVKVLAVEPNRSEWDCRLEGQAVRLGWRVVKGLRRDDAQRLVAERNESAFESLDDFLRRARLPQRVLQSLAMGGAFLGFGLRRRQALWRLLGRLTPSKGLRAQMDFLNDLSPVAESNVPLAGMDRRQAVWADFAGYGLSTLDHPMAVLRKRVEGLPRTRSGDIKRVPSGRWFSCAGLVIVRQRPGTAKGVTFATLEDEEGFCDLILRPDVYRRYRELFLSHAFLVAEGRTQRDADAASLLLKRLRPVFQDAGQAETTPAGSRNWH